MEVKARPVERFLRVAELIQAKGERLDFQLLTPGVALDRAIEDMDVMSPGLALAGFTRRLPGGRTLIFGETEISYLASLEPGVALERLEELFHRPIPLVVVSKGLPVPDTLLDPARRAGVPVFRSPLPTGLLYRRLKPFLESALAPQAAVHGSLADVYGVGLLFVGESGVGKSECVLDLVERGHRLVADDLVIATRRGNEVLVGQGHERQRHHMEIRGVGIIDIQALFGIRAIRQQKRIEVVVHLDRWEDTRVYDRTGLAEEQAEILGVDLPKVTIPLNPGKNITVISEVVAMNHLLKYTGVDSAREFDRRLRGAMRPVKDYLEEDYE